MDEYTLIQDITTYKYPAHYKFSKEWDTFHKQWIPIWTDLLSNLIEKDNVKGIEIGTFYGSCAVWLLDKVLTGQGSHLYTINPIDNEYVEPNLAPYKNVTLIKDTSYNALIKLSNEHKPGSFDFVYIDGCHFAKYVLEDAVLSFPLLKEGGFLIFDDYNWGYNVNDEKLKPKLGIDTFLQVYNGHYKTINIGWQVYLQKIKCVYDPEMVKSLAIAL